MGPRDLVKRITNMRLRTRYAIALLVILAILGTIVIGSGQFFKQQAIEQEEEDLNQTTQLAAGQVEKSIEGSLTYLRSESSEFNSRANLTNQERTSELLNNTLTNSEILVATVIDKNGTIQDIRGQGITDAKRRNIIGTQAQGAYVYDLLETNQNEFVEPPVEEKDGRVSVTMSTNIQINGSTEGVLAGSIFFLDDQENSQRSFLDGPGNVDYFGALRALNTETQSAFVEYRGENKTIVLYSQGNRFNDAIIHEKELERSGWVVRVERDRSTLTNRLQLLQFLQFGSLVAVLLSVFGLGFFEYRTNLKQTERLIGGFEQIAQGNFDYRPSLSGAREWEQIGEGFGSMATGIKEREQAIREREKQIRERERRLSVLNRVLRHNLQNDMTVIQGQAEIIPITDSEEMREQASEKIIEMSQGLVDHGKKARRLETVMENAQDPPAEMDLVEKVGEILSSYSDEHPEFTVTTNFPDHAYVEAVSGIEFGIESLIENAFEHNTSDDPAVWVNINRGDEVTEIEIRDNGPGIPEHEIEVLRQDEETSLEHGSGIGLWLSYWAVVKSDGELAFAGQEKEGGCVTVSLPNTEPPESALEAEGETDEETSQIDDLLDIPE